MPEPISREARAVLPNPIGMDGVEFIQFSTARPQALGSVLQNMGFEPVARHRSREVQLYRQGAMNLVVDAHPGPATETHDAVTISAIGIRVKDAAAARRGAVERGAWPIATRVGEMELNIPAIHGVGSSRIHFIDRYAEFSIWDIDFVALPHAARNPPALAGLHWFGVVQYIGNERTEDWTEFYREILGFAPVPDAERQGILPKGRVLRSPCGSFHLQLIEPEPGILDIENDEELRRIGLGTPDVLAAVQALTARGIAFIESDAVHSGARGALTSSYLGGVMFELVHDERDAAA